MTTELLAPAGGREALVAAVQSGADAVYMGFGAFNARRSARNFSDEEFRAAVSYCHLRGVKVYLTLNTLVTDRELSALAAEARTASECGVDAILVQDWGVLATLQKIIPDVPLHASTQMSLHTLSGVQEAARLGMTRAVLARELSRGEIAEICQKSPIEIETFVHGALCMCYSGQCEMSAVIGRRSGNRGACAQPCRLPYGFSGKVDGHPLSLKDANLAPFVPEMMDMGVACLKIEGRMKRPEYVAVVTEIYARLLREHRGPTKDEQKKLALAFSRDGFTEGYYCGVRGREMFGTRPENARWPEDWFSEIRARYEKENLRLVPLALECTIRAGEPMTLTAEDADGHRVTVTGAIPEAARSRAVTAEEVETRLKKTGGTAFSAAQCAVALDGGLAVSAGALNALRREALAQMEAQRTAVPARRTFDFVPPKTVKNSADKPLLTVSIHKAEQLSEELVALVPARVYVPVELLPQLDLSPYLGKSEFFAVLPRIYRTQDEPILRALLEDAAKKGVTGVSLANLGHLSLVRVRLVRAARRTAARSQQVPALRGHRLRQAPPHGHGELPECKRVRLSILYRAPCVRPGRRRVRKCAGADRPARRALPRAARVGLPQRDRERKDSLSRGQIAGLAEPWPALCLPALHDGIARGLRAHAARVSGRDGRSAGEYHPWALLSRRRMNPNCNFLS